MLARVLAPASLRAEDASSSTPFPGGYGLAAVWAQPNYLDTPYQSVFNHFSPLHCCKSARLTVNTLSRLPSVSVNTVSKTRHFGKSVSTSRFLSVNSLSQVCSPSVIAAHFQAFVRNKAEKVRFGAISRKKEVDLSDPLSALISTMNSLSNLGPAGVFDYPRLISRTALNGA